MKVREIYVANMEFHLPIHESDRTETEGEFMHIKKGDEFWGAEVHSNYVRLENETNWIEIGIEDFIYAFDMKEKTE